jgi:hypothetical protein
MESVSVTQELIEKYRDINVNHDWWDFVEEDFKEKMEANGIEVDKIYFSGFWSQGDGACFEGYISCTETFLDKCCKPLPDGTDEYPTIRVVVANGGRVRLTVRHSGHYYHENCTSWSMDMDYPSNVLPTPTDFHQQVVEQYDKLFEAEADAFEKEATMILKGFMRALYRELEQEHDHLTSDEAVTDTIIANDLHLTEGE